MTRWIAFLLLLPSISSKMPPSTKFESIPPGRLARAPGSQDCGIDEEWDQCGTQCEASCADTTPPACPPSCRGSGGCRCRLDLVRHWDGRCRPSTWCNWNAPTTTTTTTWAPNACPPYQRFMPCGSRCEPTCNPIAIGCGATAGCAPPRCECIPGYVRWNNQCIPAANCPPTAQTCGFNEVFMRCSSACEPSCYSPVQNCDRQCGAPRCQCARGYYRRPDPYGDCVMWPQCGWGGLRREERPDECRENEEFKECTKQCEPTCADRHPKCASTECGPPGCECSPGFLRISVHESVCISPEMCPARKRVL